MCGSTCGRTSRIESRLGIIYLTVALAIILFMLLSLRAQAGACASFRSMSGISSEAIPVGTQLVGHALRSSGRGGGLVMARTRKTAGKKTKAAKAEPVRGKILLIRVVGTDGSLAGLQKLLASKTAV